MIWEIIALTIVLAKTAIKIPLAAICRVNLSPTGIADLARVMLMASTSAIPDVAASAYTPAVPKYVSIKCTTKNNIE